MIAFIVCESSSILHISCGIIVIKIFIVYNAWKWIVLNDIFETYYFSSLIKRKQPLKLTIIETHPDSAPSIKTCEYWFRQFKKKDKERWGQAKKFEDEELQEILDRNPARTLKKLAGLLDVRQNTVSKCLKAMGKIQMEGKWVPHKLPELAIQNR